MNERQQAVVQEFIRWFAQDEIQAAWTRLGGYTSNKEVLASEEFLRATPYNPAFAETLTFVKNFWNVPVFGDVLAVSQQELGSYIIGGEGTAEETMNAIAEQQQQILRATGLIEE